MDLKVYIQKASADGTAVGKAMSLDNRAGGINYKSAKGLESRGKIKNVYTESYAEADGVRTFHPSDVSKEAVREATSFELTLVFSGSSRRTAFSNVYEYMRAGRFYYWDNYRQKLAFLMLEDAVETDEDVLKGVPYIIVTFKLTNIWGHTKANATLPTQYIKV